MTRTEQYWEFRRDAVQLADVELDTLEFMLEDTTPMSKEAGEEFAAAVHAEYEKRHSDA